METCTKIFQWCTPCCNNFENYSQITMIQIDKALGNIKKSQKSMQFIGLMDMQNGRAKLIHYQASKSMYDDIKIPETDDGLDLGEAQQQFLMKQKIEKAENARLKYKASQILEI